MSLNWEQNQPEIPPQTGIKVYCAVIPHFGHIDVLKTLVCQTMQIGVC